MDFLSQFLSEVLSEGWKLWLSAAVIFFMAEGVNPGTFALFLCGTGALAVAGACLVFGVVNESAAYQLLLFAGASLASIVFLRPVLARLLKGGAKLDGLESYAGKRGKALTALRVGQPGSVMFEGTEWAAVLCEDCPDVQRGEAVEIVKMDGLTFLVKPR